MGMRHGKGLVMRLILGNACFGAVVAAWYVAFGDNREVMIAGTVIVFVSFVIGTSMGYALSSARDSSLPRVRRAASAGVDASVFDHIQ